MKLMVKDKRKVYHCMSVGNGGRTGDSKGLWENRGVGLGGMNQFPCVWCCFTLFHLFYSRLVNIQSLTVILLGMGMFVCV